MILMEFPPEILVHLSSFFQAPELQSLWSSCSFFRDLVKNVEILRIPDGKIFQGFAIQHRLGRLKEIHGLVRLQYTDLKIFLWNVSPVVRLQVLNSPQTPRFSYDGLWIHGRHIWYFHHKPQFMPNEGDPVRILFDLDNPATKKFRLLQGPRPCFIGDLEYNEYNAYMLFVKCYPNFPHHLLH